MNDRAVERVPADRLTDGVRSLIPKLSQEKKRLAYNACRLIIIGDMKQRFQTSTTPEGRPWPKLKFPRPGGKKTDKPLMDTGKLFASLTAVPQDDGIYFGSNLDYATIQNYGGIKKPKRKFLAIPMTLEAKRAGSPRRFKRKLVAVFRSNRRGTLIEQTKKGPVVQYLLVKQAVIPARTFIGISPKAWDQIYQVMVSVVASASPGPGSPGAANDVHRFGQ